MYLKKVSVYKWLSFIIILVFLQTESDSFLTRFKKEPILNKKEKYLKYGPIALIIIPFSITSIFLYKQNCESEGLKQRLITSEFEFGKKNLLILEKEHKTEFTTKLNEVIAQHKKIADENLNTLLSRLKEKNFQEIQALKGMATKECKEVSEHANDKIKSHTLTYQQKINKALEYIDKLSKDFALRQSRVNVSFKEFDSIPYGYLRFAQV